jgi:dTDP-4-amino-4,6-dideoxygalactose transaminase
MLQKTLKKQGIETLIHYPVPPHMQKAYAAMNFEPAKFPLAKIIADEVLSLPSGPQLNEKQQDYLINSVIKALKIIQ